MYAVNMPPSPSLISALLDSYARFNHLQHALVLQNTGRAFLSRDIHQEHELMEVLICHKSLGLAKGLHRPCWLNHGSSKYDTYRAKIVIGTGMLGSMEIVVIFGRP